MTTMKTMNNVDHNSDREYNRNKRAARARQHKSAICIHKVHLSIKMNILLFIAIIIAVYNIGGWFNKITTRQVVLDRYIEYTVKDGDTLSSIASKYKMSDSKDYRQEMYAIIEANDCIDTDASVLRHGSTILVPIYKYELTNDCMSPNAVE